MPSPSSHALLIDIGNSRIKWLNHANNQPLERTVIPSSLSHHQANWLTAFANQLAQIPTPLTCFISCVASSSVLEQVKTAVVTAFAEIKIHQIAPQKTLGRFTLAYDVPLQMGPDRFAQLLGAQALCPQQNHLVISAGTATTIDGVLATGEHLGGVILPSTHLMRASLHQYTARLPLEGGELTRFHAPNSTLDALATGVRLANSGAVMAFMQTYMPNSPATWIVCGGSAETLAYDLKDAANACNASIMIVPALCLLGLDQFRLAQPI